MPGFQLFKHFLLHHSVLAKLVTSSMRVISPFNAETIFVSGTKTQNIFENHLHPVMLVFIGELLPSTPR